MNEAQVLSPCGKHERRFWVEVVTPDPDHAPADNPNHVSVASYCALCANDTLIEELGKCSAWKASMLEFAGVLENVGDRIKVSNLQEAEKLWRVADRIMDLTKPHIRPRTG